MFLNELKAYEQLQILILEKTKRIKQQTIRSNFKN